jgi:hypothetical protein
MSTNEIECDIYKSLKKDEMYVFIEANTELSELPDALLKMLGQTEKVMTLTLIPERKMARGTAHDILKSIANQGFYLQMPDNPHINATPAYHEKLSEKNI